MTARRQRTIVLVRIASPEELADSIAAAVGGRARAVELLRDALTYLEQAP